MTKPIHMMLRISEEQRSLEFYDKAFGLTVAGRFVFETFTLLYLRSPESDFELELTVNHDRSKPYELGDAYGHLAFVVADLTAEHHRMTQEAIQPQPIKELAHDGKMLARFFFVTDPDGYKIEVLQRFGRYT